MSTPFYQVDAFTDRPFSGNPAAICLPESPAETDWMQAVAAEMNLSETAFLVQRGEAYDLRWFTPSTEVDLCGHATLAAAHVLDELGRLGDHRRITFATRSGRLYATITEDGIELDFPATPVVPTPPPDDLLASLGLERAEVFRSRFDYLVAIEDAAQLRTLRPDFATLAQIPTRGVIVTAPSDVPGKDFLSRFFAPAAGIDEDPVTGSAHCALAPWWAERLGRSGMQAYQASPRGGHIHLQLDGDRVRLLGRAVTILSGRIHV